MSPKSDQGSDWTRLLWPNFAAAEAGAAFALEMLEAFSPPKERLALPETAWTSENRIVLELSAARLRCFAEPENGATPLVVCAPFALHDAGIADLFQNHSLMAVLREGGAPLYLVEWLSAGETQAFRRIDDYLSDLNIFIDEIGGRADLIGLCQGGWLGLIYAARFPAKARKLVLAAAPVDIEAEESSLSRLAQSTPIEGFRELVRLGKGLARGGEALQFWGLALDGGERVHDLLQSDLPRDSAEFASLISAFRAWNAHVIDLPGAYYLEVVEKFYKRNELARGDFSALGRRIDLRRVRSPLYLIVARDDVVTAPKQTFACADLVGTPKDEIRKRTAPGAHVSLFAGALTLKTVWPDVLEWLGEA
jgi:poly(3-hydroxyalkanoate) synthetase